jgi:hypothetical protein
VWRQTPLIPSVFTSPKPESHKRFARVACWRAAAAIWLQRGRECRSFAELRRCALPYGYSNSVVALAVWCICTGFGTNVRCRSSPRRGRSHAVRAPSSGALGSWVGRGSWARVGGVPDAAEPGRAGDVWLATPRRSDSPECRVDETTALTGDPRWVPSSPEDSTLRQAALARGDLQCAALRASPGRYGASTSNQQTPHSALHRCFAVLHRHPRKPLNLLKVATRSLIVG